MEANSRTSEPVSVSVRSPAPAPWPFGTADACGPALPVHLIASAIEQSTMHTREKKAALHTKKAPKEKKPHVIARRNARERKRVQAVNQAFARLRRVIPYENKNKRLSKVKTLRIAIDYIRQLCTVLGDAGQKQNAAYCLPTPYEYEYAPFAEYAYYPNPNAQSQTAHSSSSLSAYQHEYEYECGMLLVSDRTHEMSNSPSSSATSTDNVRLMYH